MPHQSLDEKVFQTLLRRNVFLPLGLCVVTGVCFVLLVLFLLSNNRWVEHSDRVISEGNETLRLLVDSETGVRGFLLTGADDFLEPRTNARPIIPQKIDLLKSLVSDNPSQVGLLAKVKERFSHWDTLADERIAGKRVGKDVSNIRVARDGKKIMDEIRGTFMEFLSVEETLRQDRRDAARNTAQAIMVLIAVFSMVIGGLLALFGRRQLMALSRRFSESLAAQVEQNALLETQGWFTASQANLQEQFRGNPGVGEVCQRALAQLVRATGAEVGRMFLLNDEKVLESRASFAFDERTSNAPSRYAIGQGAVGECAQQKKLLELTDLPVDYLRVSSALGAVTVTRILVLPILIDGLLKGVAELGYRGNPTSIMRRFLEDASERIAHAVSSAQNRAFTQDLLEETQRQSEELQAQQEELERNNEDLQQKSHELLAQQHHLEQANHELEQQQTQLEEQKQRLEESNRELHRTRNDVQEKAQNLELANRYKSEFLANMSHELRTPLNSILLLANLLTENSRDALNPEEIEYASTIHSSATDLLNLINDILDLSKVEAGKLDLNVERFAMKDLCASVKRMFGPQMKRKGLEFDCRLTDEAPASLLTDKTRVEQVVRNLLSNALKFTEKGSVTVEIDRPEDEFKDFGLVLRVRDTGIGIPASKQRLVFEAFNQVDGTISRKYGGTGLGLTISRELAHLLGGRLTLQSKEGEGTTFSLYLPKTAPRVASEKNTDKPQEFYADSTQEPAEYEPAHGIADDRESLKKGDKSILLIEDDPVFAKALFKKCQKKGFKCLVAADGERGVADASQFLPTAIILDIRLPGLSGLGVLDRLKRNPSTRHIPVHAISVEDRAKEVLHMGAVGFATKPISNDAIENVLERLMAHVSKETKYVLLIEDNPVEQQNLKKVIGNGDVKTIAVSTGKEAIEHLEKQTFDCVVLDLKLPDISGFDVISALKETSNKVVPVIIYTARDLTREEHEKLSECSSSIVLKGARSPERLLDEVTLFLHKVEDSLTPSQKEMLEKVRHREDIFQNKDILIVDDDMRNIFALRSVLLKKGFQVHIARNGQESIDKLNEVPRTSVVLMDVMMPGMDGNEAIRLIRKDSRFQNLPIIAVTAKAMKGDKEKCLAAGASDYLSKPVDMNSLLSLLRIWLTR